MSIICLGTERLTRSNAEEALDTFEYEESQISEGVYWITTPGNFQAKVHIDEVTHGISNVRVTAPSKTSVNARDVVYYQTIETVLDLINQLLIIEVQYAIKRVLLP